MLLVLVGFFYVSAVWLVTAPFDPGRYQAGRALRRLAVSHVALTRLWRFETEGTPPEGPRRPYVVVSNHESYADIFLVSHFPWEMKWLSKHTIFQIPVMGWMMRMALDVPVRRGERESAIAALAECRDRLARRVSVMIFPEGTRTSSGEMQKFKSGAFRVAIETGTPILPLVVHGTRPALRKGDWRFGVVDAEVRVLEPIETAGMTMADMPALRDTTRARIAEELALMKATQPQLTS